MEQYFVLLYYLYIIVFSQDCILQMAVWGCFRVQGRMRSQASVCF